MRRGLGMMIIIAGWVMVPLAAWADQQAGSDERIVTVGAAVTEAMYALGWNDQIVAVDQSSVMPPEARKKPQIGYVRALSAEGILSLRPTLVVATDDIGPELARRQLVASGVRLVVVPSPSSPEEVEAVIRELGEVTGRQKQAQEVVTQLRNDLAASRHTLEGPRPRVVFLMQPPDGGLAPMAAGREVKADALIQLAGGENPFQAFVGYRPVGLESKIQVDPDIIVIGYTGDGTEIARRLRSQSGWSSLRAVRNGQLHAVSLGEVLSFGPSLGSSVKQLADWIKQLPSGTP